MAGISAADMQAETEKLLADLGQVAVSTGPSKPAAPPPPPVRTDASSSVVIQYKAKKREQTDGQSTPQSRQTHVTSYSLQVKNRGPPPAVAPKPKKPQPPKEEAKNLAEEFPRSGSISGAPVGLVAYGPGLDSFEIGSVGKFQVSCPQGTRERDLDVRVLGPTGSKSVEIESLGNGQFSVSYNPSTAGEHTVHVIVKGEAIPGSPFTVNVQYASFTDKCKAEGDGLKKGTTDKPCVFRVRCEDGVAAARLRVHILGPSKAEPVEMEEEGDERTIKVTYHPSAPGDYSLRVLWGDAHVPGSPFTVPVSGDIKNDPYKVEISGDGINGGETNAQLSYLVRPLVGSGPGPLSVRMTGPSKPTIQAEEKEEGINITYSCLDPGEYCIYLKWGEYELPNCPYMVRITGEQREVSPTKCRAEGRGIREGNVGETCKFKVLVEDDAGPGPLNVSIKGPHPPKPIEISNNEDGSMDVCYNPKAPGDYSISVLWGGKDIPGSPFVAKVTGAAVRHAKKITATGNLLKGSTTLQLGTVTVHTCEEAGPGPLRALCEGVAKPELSLTNNNDGTILVSFCAPEPGKYKLHLKWGADEEADHISGSPFEIEVKDE